MTLKRLPASSAKSRVFRDDNLSLVVQPRTRQFDKFTLDRLCAHIEQFAILSKRVHSLPRNAAIVDTTHPAFFRVDSPIRHHGLTTLRTQLRLCHLSSLPIECAASSTAKAATVRYALLRTFHQTPQGLHAIYHIRSFISSTTTNLLPTRKPCQFGRLLTLS
jgi:hypothetical protein